MEKESIKLSPTKYQEFYQEMISKSLKMQQEIFSQYGNQEMDLTHRFFDYTYKLITAIGLVAGFGFTAIGRVMSIQLFTTGELVLFSAIFSGIYWIQYYYGKNISSLQKSSNAIKRIFVPRDEISKKINQDYVNEGVVYKEDIQKLNEQDNKLLDFFSKDKGAEKKKDESLPLKIIMVLFALGSLLLLSSFLFGLSIKYQFNPDIIFP